MMNHTKFYRFNNEKVSKSSIKSNHQISKWPSMCVLRNEV